MDMILMALRRENGDMQRLRIDRKFVETRKITLPDELYIDMVIRYLVKSEVITMAKKRSRESRSDQSTRPCRLNNIKAKRVLTRPCRLEY